MLTSWRSTTSVGIDEIPALSISKPYMGIATMRKPGDKVNTSRPVSVTRDQDTEERCEGKLSCPVLEQR
jgi:hypothetical protein